MSKSCSLFAKINIFDWLETIILRRTGNHCFQTKKCSVCDLLIPTVFIYYWTNSIWNFCWSRCISWWFLVGTVILVKSLPCFARVGITNLFQLHDSEGILITEKFILYMLFIPPPSLDVLKALCLSARRILSPFICIFVVRS